MALAAILYIKTDNLSGFRMVLEVTFSARILFFFSFFVDLRACLSLQNTVTATFEKTDWL
jgi:hypothetical protein